MHESLFGYELTNKSDYTQTPKPSSPCIMRSMRKWLTYLTFVHVVVVFF